MLLWQGNEFDPDKSHGDQKNHENPKSHLLLQSQRSYTQEPRTQALKPLDGTGVQERTIFLQALTAPPKSFTSPRAWPTAKARLFLKDV